MQSIASKGNPAMARQSAAANQLAPENVKEHYVGPKLVASCTLAGKNKRIAPQ